MHWSQTARDYFARKQQHLSVPLPLCLCCLPANALLNMDRQVETHAEELQKANCQRRMNAQNQYATPLYTRSSVTHLLGLLVGVKRVQPYDVPFNIPSPTRILKLACPEIFIRHLRE